MLYNRGYKCSMLVDLIFEELYVFRLVLGNKIVLSCSQPWHVGR